MAKHTPGPWAVGVRRFMTDRGGHEVEVERIDVCATAEDFETDQLVGPPCICSMFGNQPDFREGIPLANARLIAAAPEMLEALRTIIYASDKCQGHRNCDHDMTGWTLARAVLDRVEGNGAVTKSDIATCIGGQTEHDSRPYGEWCRDSAACAGKGYCPLDPTCGD